MRFCVQVKTNSEMNDFAKSTLERYGLQINRTRTIITGLGEDFEALADMAKDMLPYDSRFPVITSIADKFMDGDYSNL